MQLAILFIMSLALLLMIMEQALTHSFIMDLCGSGYALMLDKVMELASNVSPPYFQNLAYMLILK